MSCKKILGTMLSLVIGFSFLMIPVLVRAQGGNPPPKCEKCYKSKGPDGKIICEPVPCP